MLAIFSLRSSCLIREMNGLPPCQDVAQMHSLRFVARYIVSSVSQLFILSGLPHNVLNSVEILKFQISKSGHLYFNASYTSSPVGIFKFVLNLLIPALFTHAE